MAGRHLRGPTPLGAVIAVVLAMTACGGGMAPEDAARTPIGRAITAELVASDITELSETDATCISGEVVAGIGEDELRALGVTPESVNALGEATLSGDQIETVVDAWATCVDVDDLVSGSLRFDIDDADAACLSEGIDLDTAKGLLAASLSGGFDASDPAVQRLALVALQCGISIS